MVFLHALGGVGGLLLIGLVGYILAGKGWFSDDSLALLPKLVTLVSLPPYLFYTVTHSFPREDLLHLLYGTFLPALSLLLCFSLAFFGGKLLKVEKKHFGLFCTGVANSNTIFIGIPVNTALFGDEALPYVLLYYFASTTFFWTVGHYFIKRDAQEQARTRLPLGQVLRQIFSPPVLGFLLGLMVLAFNWEVPGFLQDTTKHLGNLTTPLALIYIGATLQRMGLLTIRLSRDLSLALTGRMVICPLIMLGLTLLFPVPVMTAKVFIMQASLPAIMQIAILSAFYRSDPEYGALLVSLSTVLSILTVPLYMVLLQTFM